MIRNLTLPWFHKILIGAIILLGVGWAYNAYTRQVLKTELATTAGALEIQSKALVSVQRELKEAGEINERQTKAIAEVDRLREIDGTILKGLVQDLDASRSRDRVALNRIATLEKTNEQVRAYLNSAPPAAVSCVLDKTCSDQVHRNGDSGEGAASGVAGPVRAGGATGKQNQR